MLVASVVPLWSLPSAGFAAASQPTTSASADSGPVDEACVPGQPDVIYGTAGRDVLDGTSGDDILCGFGGADLVRAGDGDDEIYGGSGADVVEPDAGDDTVHGGDGDDTVAASNGNDAFFGGSGNDSGVGGAGADLLRGDDGDDRLQGGDGDDVLVGGGGHDALLGQAGSDTLNGQAGTDRLDGDDGTDTCAEAESRVRCEVGDEALANPYDSPIPVTMPPALPGEVTADGGFDGLSVSIDSLGGIYPWDVDFSVARSSMHGRVADVMAGAAYDVRLPAGAPAFESARLTLPYAPTRLDGYPEEDLRLFTHDEASRLWLPVPGAQQVDEEDNTVTATVEHFSVYAVLKIRTSEQWREVFGDVPVRCVPAGADGTPIDVSMIIDTSGSMSTNDRGALRVAAAKELIAQMRPQDRVGVITFASGPTVRLGLTQLDSPDDLALVNTALDAGKRASGATDIPGAVRTGTAMLAAPTGDRLRIALLLTDGVSSSAYDPALTEAAAAAGFQIHTIGLGSSLDTALLQSIADGTGGSYRHLSNASRLSALHEQLAGDAVDDGKDEERDGLPDCLERSGTSRPLDR